MFPIAKKSPPDALPVGGTALPHQFLNRGRINLCLAVNVTVLIGLVGALVPYVEHWIPLLGSVALLAVAVVSVINATLDVARTHYGNACYRLQMSEQKASRLKQDLAAAQRIDELSGCHNETYIREELGRLIAISKRSEFHFSALAIRIDQFVDILGRHGQRGSNDLLEVFGSILKRCVREIDSVARLNDENFLVLLSESVDEDAMIVCNRIVDLTHQIRINGAPDLRVTVSVGVTSYAGHEDVDQVIEQADIALRFAIDQGGDCVAGFLHKENAAA